MPAQEIILVSACLLGVCCRYDGKSKPCHEIMKHAKGAVIVPVCPEQLGGLPTPRPPAQLQHGDGLDVIEGRASVVTRDEEQDVTESFLKGARQVAYIAHILGATRCILKSKSPSCGLTPVVGVTSALLITMGFKVTEL